MRTTNAAASDVAQGGNERPVYFDALFRDVKDHVVKPPEFPTNVRFADTHAHLDMLHHPELALARCMLHHVGYVITVIDPTEEPRYTLENLEGWLHEAQVLADEIYGGEKAQGSSAQTYSPRDMRETSLDKQESPSAYRGLRNSHPTLEPFSATENESSSERPQGSSAQTYSPRDMRETSLDVQESPSAYRGLRNSHPTLEPFSATEVRIIVGCHPHNAAKYNKDIECALLDTLKDNRARAIGEIGLDYHYDYSPRDIQQRVYQRQLELAHEYNVPVSLHMREAHDDGLRILKEVGAPPAGVLLHCFNLEYARLEPFLELGCYVAYGGPLTFKKSEEVRDAARRTPLERIVTETDAPFMAPHPVRGVVCGPEHVVFTAACLAEVFGIALAANETAQDEASHTGALAFYERLFQNTLDFFE